MTNEKTFDDLYRHLVETWIEEQELRSGPATSAQLIDMTTRLQDIRSQLAIVRRQLTRGAADARRTTKRQSATWRPVVSQVRIAAQAPTPC